MSKDGEAQPLIASRLADLPAERRWHILWRLVSDESFPDVWSVVLRQARCNQRPPGMPLRASQQAVLGSDGRYHLGCRAEHHQVLSWWTDGVAVRTHSPHGYTNHGDGVSGGGHVDWVVTFAEDAETPEAHKVPRGQRCPVREPWWPPPVDQSPRGRQRALLIDSCGSACGACGEWMGVVVDHSHATGLVRGLLCRHCNNLVDLCPHLTGCRFARYLADPPAAHLGLTYVDISNRTPAYRARLAKIQALLEENPDIELDFTWGTVPTPTLRQ